KSPLKQLLSTREVVKSILNLGGGEAESAEENLEATTTTVETIAKQQIHTATDTPTVKADFQSSPGVNRALNIHKQLAPKPEHKNEDKTLSKQGNQNLLDAENAASAVKPPLKQLLSTREVVKSILNAGGGEAVAEAERAELQDARKRVETIAKQQIHTATDTPTVKADFQSSPGVNRVLNIYKQPAPKPERKNEGKILSKQGNQDLPDAENPASLVKPPLKQLLSTNEIGTWALTASDPFISEDDTWVFVDKNPF
ncbi:MAG: hypothetical protein AAGI90_07005, partial [Chlamydiota bacterium]